MNNHLTAFKKWYELRLLREQVLIIALAWAILYAIFNLFLYSPLHTQTIQLSTANKKISDEIQITKTQISALNKIADSPLYKKWSEEHKSFLSLQSSYKLLLQTSPTKQWQDIIKNILRSQSNIVLVQIKNSPETPYSPDGIVAANNHIYQQRISLSVLSNYYDIVSYLQRLEEVLPSIHWDSLTYQVMNYPNAKIDMEFSIVYEKPA